MNQIEYKTGEEYDYIFLFNLTQAFVDTIRSLGGNNAQRLLLISGAKSNLESSLPFIYKMPVDPSNKTAISIHYYFPLQFALVPEDNPGSYTDISSGYVFHFKPMENWGSESDYKEMINYFENMKKDYIDNGIPVVISQVGVLTEQQKEHSSIREYLNAVFSLASNYDGVMSCLWDT